MAERAFHHVEIDFEQRYGMRNSLSTSIIRLNGLLSLKWLIHTLFSQRCVFLVDMCCQGIILLLHDNICHLVGVHAEGNVAMVYIWDPRPKQLLLRPSCQYLHIFITLTNSHTESIGRSIQTYIIHFECFSVLFVFFACRGMRRRRINNHGIVFISIASYENFVHILKWIWYMCKLLIMHRMMWGIHVRIIRKSNWSGKWRPFCLSLNMLCGEVYFIDSYNNITQKSSRNRTLCYLSSSVCNNTPCV